MSKYSRYYTALKDKCESKDSPLSVEAFKLRHRRRQILITKRRVLELLKTSGWSIHDIEVWLTTPLQELDNWTPKQALTKLSTTSKSYHSKAFKILCKALNIKPVLHVKKKTIQVTQE